MPAWTNIRVVTLENLKVGVYILFNETYFEKMNDNSPLTTLRCIESNPSAGYGEGVIIQLESTKQIWVDTNRQSANHDLRKK